MSVIGPADRRGPSGAQAVGIAFLLRSERAERIAGLFVVLAILISALVALYQSVALRRVSG